MEFATKYILPLIKELGFVKGIFATFFFVAHAVLFKQQKGRLEDRQKEIDRLAAENREYRERFLKLMDKSFGHSPQGNTPGRKRARKSARKTESKKEEV